MRTVPLIVSAPTSRWKLVDVGRGLLMYPVVVGLGLIAGYAELKKPTLVKGLVLLPALLAAFAVSVGTLFGLWLFAAAFVQGPSGAGQSGHIYFKYLFLVPPLIMVARMVAGDRRRRARLMIVDAVPLAYLGYIALRVYMFPTVLSGTDASARGIYEGIGLAMIGYYLAAFLSKDTPRLMAGALLWSAPAVSVFAFVDQATGWNPWNTSEVGAGSQIRRVVATFSSAGALGAYLGMCVVFAVAILAFSGPKSLRRPAMLTIVLSAPALFFTLSRGPVLGAVAVCLLLLVLGNRSRWPSALVFGMVALSLVGAWGAISGSSVYKERLGVTETVRTRQEIQRVSLELVRQKPVFGWGYNTFDKAKLTVQNRDPAFDELTSHDTFLTTLVELGIVGLILSLAAWVAVAWRGIIATRHKQMEGWIAAAGIGTAAAYAIGALTYDARFFSLVTTLPWVAIGIVRSRLSDPANSSS